MQLYFLRSTLEWKCSCSDSSRIVVAEVLCWDIWWHEYYLIPFASFHCQFSVHRATQNVDNGTLAQFLLGLNGAGTWLQPVIPARHRDWQETDSPQHLTSEKIKFGGFDLTVSSAQKKPTTKKPNNNNNSLVPTKGTRFSCLSLGQDFLTVIVLM